MDLTQYQPHLDWLAAQRAAMEALTERWANINSGSYHLAGLRAMRAALAEGFAPLGGEAEVVPLAPIFQVDAAGQTVAREMAEALTIRKHPDAPVQILLVGHMDTVYGPEHPFQTCVRREAHILNGPGVADLKGGLVVMLHALMALERSEFAGKIGWQVVLNPDEEIGSSASDALLKEAAKGKRLGLVYEPALADGTLAGARKGSGNFTIVVHGQAAHAGRNPEDGRNAIVALADLTQRLFALNGRRAGLTLNPGKVEGGGALNVVPDLAILRFNIRTGEAADEAWVIEEIQQILADYGYVVASSSPLRGEVGRGPSDGNAVPDNGPTPSLPLRGRELYRQTGFSVELHGQFTRTPKPMSPENQAVFDLVQQCGAALGLTLGIKPSGGCCDGNNLWRHGLPNVDTLGVRGANIHSEGEIVYLDSLVERAQLSALLLMRMAAEGAGV